MTSQPGKVRIVTNDTNVRSGTTVPSEAVLRLSGVTLTTDDLDKLAAALIERMQRTLHVVLTPDIEPDYIPVKRNIDRAPFSEY